MSITLIFSVFKEIWNNIWSFRPKSEVWLWRFCCTDTWKEVHENDVWWWKNITCVPKKIWYLGIPPPRRNWINMKINSFFKLLNFKLHVKHIFFIYISWLMIASIMCNFHQNYRLPLLLFYDRIPQFRSTVYLSINKLQVGNDALGYKNKKWYSVI